MRVVRILAAALLLSSSAIASPAVAQDNTAQKSSDKSPSENTKKLKPSDRKFLVTAYDHEYEELAVGTLAAHQGASEQVKTIGSRIVNDETAALNNLQKLAKKDDLTLPDKVTPGLMDALPQLEKLTGRQFDDAFLAHVRARDTMALNSFEQEVKNGTAADLKALAAGEIPVIQGQLGQIKTGAAEMQKGSSSKSPSHE
ncbi:MAG TPA: DUF4142 domain-containing protein [Polyangiaceae bacterium]|nr:DUF4142 domain-containing protein [Polyangiaceae bacterium]